MKDKDIIIIQNLLIENNEILMKEIVDAHNALLICIRGDGKVTYRTAEELVEIRKRHTHDI